ncbi:hypothetical protein LINGRAPRIM_LOCUS36, partial [Linum grandiflorum]
QKNPSHQTLSKAVLRSSVLAGVDEGDPEPN